MGLPPCRVRSLLRKRRPSRSRPSRMLIWLFIRAAATDVAWLPALGAGSDQKSHRKRPALILSKLRSIPTDTATGRHREIQHSERIEAELAKQPVITVPTIVLHGESDGVSPPQSSERHDRFLYRPRMPIAGHFLPREPPEAVVPAVRELG